MSIRVVPLIVVASALLSACTPAPVAHADKDVLSSKFPAAARPVSPIVSPKWSTEEARDKVRESTVVMDLGGVTPGMTVADIGAGEGYYTIRLAARVGEKGRVLAQDVVPAVRDRLADRVTRERLDNVSVKLGQAADPTLPSNSFDRIFLIHMYHEIAAPYEFLWRMRPSLKPDGRVIIVDADRKTADHGTPPKLLSCELAAVGYQLIEQKALPQSGVYLTVFEARGERPAPSAIRACGG